MQPAGYIHSLGLLDPARYVRQQLQRLGSTVTLAKNRLREDAINIIFGAHLGFPPELRTRYTCLFFNLEQLGEGGANLSPEYLDLLRSSAVIDYDADNVSSYCSDPADVPLVPMAYAPYLDRVDTARIEDRPIDLLFFGSMNTRRKALIDRIEACGISVSVFDQPLYGPERDEFIIQAKAVLNCHFYECSRFEQVRAAHCLSLGTPVISERRMQTRPTAAFEDSVSWFEEDGLEQFFRDTYGSNSFFENARAQLARFRQIDPIEDFAELVAFATGVHKGCSEHRENTPTRPEQINLGSGWDYKPGWLNVDALESAEPDLVLDLGQTLELPLLRPTRFGGQVQLEIEQLTRIHAKGVLEQVSDLPMLMGNALKLLKTGGEIEIEVAYDKSATSRPNPSHLRAINENSWTHYIDWFWQLGWFEHRFEMSDSGWLDQQMQPCPKEAAAFMRVVLRKTVTSPSERTVARTMRLDFGEIDYTRPQNAAQSRPMVSQVARPVLAATPKTPAPEQVRSQIMSHIVNARHTGAQPAVICEADEIGKLLAAGNASAAVDQITKVLDASLKSHASKQQLLYPQIDKYIERLAQAIAHESNQENSALRDGGSLLIASEVSDIDRHGRALLDLSKQVDRPLLLLTDLFNTYAKRPKALALVKQRFPHADVVALPAGTYWEKCGMVFRATESIRPASIHYFGHHQDALQFIGTVGLRGPQKLLVHTGHYRPMLGGSITDMRLTKLASDRPKDGPSAAPSGSKPRDSGRAKQQLAA